VVVAGGSWSQEAGERLLREGADSIFLNHTRGWQGKDLSFLAGLPRLKRLSIIDWEIRDVSEVSALEGLEYLLMHVSARSRVGFSSLRKLRHCSFQWIPGNEDLFSSTALQHLSLIEYKEGSLDPLRGLSGLRSLKLSDNRKAADTGFLMGLAKLESLEVAHYRALGSLDGLRHTPGIRTLKVSGTRKLASLAPIASLPALETLELESLGTVPSLQFLSACRNLRAFVLMDTNVKDGKLDFLDGLPKLEKAIFENRRHYNRKREEFRKSGLSMADELNQEILADHIKRRLGRL
jgi:hypothetical protein